PGRHRRPVPGPAGAGGDLLDGLLERRRRTPGRELPLRHPPAQRGGVPCQGAGGHRGQPGAATRTGPHPGSAACGQRAVPVRRPGHRAAGRRSLGATGAERHTLTRVIDLGTGDDLARRQSLRRMRTTATGLLVLALLVFVLTHGRDGAWGYVNAAAEAGMVGAIADWFAVTALFRHPLGLPVPHTAIIPRRKASLARSLEQFVSDNFLTSATVRERYLQAE